MRTTYSAADRVHSTLQKAVKDGNVLEKIKAFELQAAAAAQADSTPKLGRDPGIHGAASCPGPVAPRADRCADAGGAADPAGVRAVPALERA